MLGAATNTNKERNESELHGNTRSGQKLDRSLVKYLVAFGSRLNGIQEPLVTRAKRSRDTHTKMVLEPVECIFVYNEFYVARQRIEAKYLFRRIYLFA